MSTVPLSAILKYRSSLFKKLHDNPNAKVEAWAKKQYSNLQERVNILQEQEKKQEPELDGSFE